MPTILNCSIIMQSAAGHGWSESHKKSADTAPGDLQPFLTALKALADNYRRPLLGADCWLKGLRVSYPLASGKGIASSGYFYSPPMYPTNNYSGAAPTLSANMRLGDVTNTKFSSVALRGFWDAVETDEELDFTTLIGAQWEALMIAYKNALVSGQYGFLSQDSTLVRRGKVTGYTVDVDGFTTFTIEKTSGPVMPAANTVVQFRGAQINNSQSVLNTTMRVAVVDATHLRTVIPTAAGLFRSAGIFTINGTSFTRYTGLQYCRLGKRSPGRPIGEAPGRQKARARS